MLPLLNGYVEKTELSYFIKNLMPLAKKLRVKSEFFASKGQMIEHKVFDTLQNQVIIFINVKFLI